MSPDFTPPVPLRAPAFIDRGALRSQGAKMEHSFLVVAAVVAGIALGWLAGSPPSRRPVPRLAGAAFCVLAAVFAGTWPAACTGLVVGCIGAMLARYLWPVKTAVAPVTREK